MDENVGEDVRSETEDESQRAEQRREERWIGKLDFKAQRQVHDSPHRISH
jgi:hypothetical protein